MNKIERMIEELCPEGVEYVGLDFLEKTAVISMGRGKVISKKEMTDNVGPYPVYSSSAKNDGIIGYYNKYMFDDERITWSIDGGGKFFYRKPHEYSVTNVCGWLKVENTNIVNTKYLYYALISEWSKKRFDYLKKAHPSVITREYLLPLPPLAIQREIVGILDKFDALETQLETLLEAEKTAREKQYAYYRDKLLTFESGVEWRKLGEVVNSINIGINPRKFFKLNPSDATGFYVTVRELNGVAGVKQYNKTDLINEEALKIINARANIEKGDILFSNTGTVGKLAIVNETPKNWGVNEGIYVIKPLSDLIDSKFLYYCLSSENIVRQYTAMLTGSTVKHVTQKCLASLLLPLPPLAEQERIVAILDKFDALTRDMTRGLPAEIEMRKKQYAYYRDKLLTFKQKSPET